MQDRPWTRSSLPQVDAFVTMTKDLPSLHIFILLSLVLNTLHVFGISGDSKMSANWGQGLSQNDLMERDTVLVVDNDDNVIGSASKKDSHVFNENQPHGILHRAFSIFIFDESDGRLLLHQRSADKITFPNVWTNTCCSHPLHGMTPNELDTPEDVKSGSVMGVKHAAARKLMQELGIDAKDSISQMKFLTRLHYWAADTVTHGPSSPWGEHEVDYVLFWVVPSKDAISLNPNPEEIQAVKWVNPEELEAMLQDRNCLFSPWFRIIYERFMKNSWWKDLKTTMNTNTFVDCSTIHEFDPPSEHLGGKGKARPLFAAFDASKKQGAYGKIKTHSESKLSQLMRLDEVFAAITLLYISPLKSNLDSEYIKKTFNSDDLAFCDDILVKVSRSFAAVIRQLPGVMLVDVLVFYLILRALDTIEDDTTAFDSHATKVRILKEFYKALDDPNWTMTGVGEGDERTLLEEFPKCQRIFQQLQPEARAVIKDITKRMADGMADFVAKDMGQGTEDMQQYNLYCHYVAGLVGEGLSRLFSASGLEHKSFGEEKHLSNQMGLFLQKTNIIRDYLEDYVDKRAWWPQTVWKKYSANGDLGYFANQADDDAKKKALMCLNELITDALELVPDCLIYLSKLECAEIFRFCAIPQVMAIATLDKCFANPNVFTGVVKIRKGLSCQLILQTNTIAEVHSIFSRFAKSVRSKALAEQQRGANDPSFERTIASCDKIAELTRDAAAQQAQKQLIKWTATASLLGSALLLKSSVGLLGWNTRDKNLVSAGLALAGGVLYWYGPWTVKTNLLRAHVLKAKRQLSY